jgi:Sugar (and other) transporter
LLFGYDTGVIAGALLFHHPGLRAGGGDDGQLVLQLRRLADLSLIDGLGRGGAFLFYAAMCAFTFWFCRRYVPETKGKHLEEIQAVFEERVAQKAALAPEPAAGT